MKKIIILILLAAGVASAQITYINVGSAPNAGNGDPARTAFVKANTNFWWLATSVRTNGNTGSGQVPISTNAPPGYFWGTQTLNYRSGITNIPTLTLSQAVLFSTPFSPTIGTNYSVSVSFDTALAAAVGFSTTSKTTNGFTITLSGTITGAVQVDYAAWPYQ